MKIILCLLILVFNTAAFAQEAATQPEQQQPESVEAQQQPARQKQLSAAELYTRGDYMAAAQVYEKEAKADPSNAYIWYNLANSYFKAGDSDLAIINYYRAFRLLPRDKDIKTNLEFALKMTAQSFKAEDIPQVVFDAFYFLSFKELRGILFLAGWVFAIFFVIFMTGYKKQVFKTALFYTAGFAAAFGLWYMARLPSETKQLAVTTVARAEVRSGPGENFPVSISVPRAHVVTVKDTKGQWANIIVEGTGAEGEGWVLKKSIEEI